MSKVNFEKNIQRLEEIVAELEKGELSLDSALKIFEEGISLARICAKRLEDAELQVKTLVKSEDGQFKLELFEKDE